MPASDRFSLVVESVTKGESQLRAFEQSLNRFSDVVEKSTKRVSDSSKKSNQDLEKFAANVKNTLQNPLQAIGSGAEKLILQFGKIGVAGLGLGVVFAGIGKASFGLIKELDEIGDSINNLSIRTGLSVNQVDKLRAASKLLNVNVESLAGGARKLAEFLEDTSTASDEARKTLYNLGVSTVTATGGQRDLGLVLEDVLSTLGKIPDKQQQLLLAQKLLGKSAVEVLPLIAAYDEATKAAERLGFGTRENLLKEIDKAGQQVDELGLKVEALKAKLAPGASFVVSIITKFIDDVSGGLPEGNAFNKALREKTTKRTTYQIQPSAVGGRPGSLIPSTPDFAEFTQTLQLNLETGIVAAAAGQKRVAEFERSQLNTVEGLKTAITELAKKRSELRVNLKNPGLSEEQHLKDKKEFDRIERQIDELNARLDRLNKKVTGGTPESHARDRARDLLNARLAGAPGIAARQQVPGLPTGFTFGGLRGGIIRTEEELSATGVFADFQPERTGPSLFRRGEARPSQLRTEAISAEQLQARNIAAKEAAEKAREKEKDRIAKAREREFRAIEEQASFQEKLIRLTAGPGGELEAVERVAAVRLEALEKQRQYADENFNIEREREKVLQDALLERLQIEQQRLREYEELSRGVFRSLREGGRGGIGSFLRGQLDTQMEQIFVNASSTIFQKAGPTLGKVGEFSGLDKLGLLKGTLFDPRNASPIVKNTTSLDKLTKSVDTLTGTMTGVALPGATLPGGTAGFTGGFMGAASDLLGIFGRDVNGLTGTGPIRGTVQANATPSVLGDPIAALGGTEALYRAGTAQSTARPGQSTAVRNLAIAGAVTAAGFGVYEGIQQGGARGALTASGSALGAAAMIPGPQQPFVMAGALIAGFVSTMLPDPKVARAKEIDRLIESNAYSEPASQEFRLNQAGQSYDYDARGNARPIVVQVQTIDSKSFVDHREDIANAMRAASMEGHQYNRTMREVVLGS